MTERPHSSLLNAAAIIVIIAGVMSAKSLITPFLLAIFISIICNAPIAWLEDRRVPKGLAIIIVIIGMLMVFFGIGYLIGGSLASFSVDTGKYEARLGETINSAIQILNNKGLNISPDQVKSLVEPGRILQFTAGALNQFAGIMGNGFLILITILFILMEFSSFSVKAAAIFVRPDQSIGYFTRITKNIRHYLWIKTITSFMVAVLIYIALLIIGVDYAILWALIAFMMNYIPSIGSIIAVIPALLFALVQFGIGGALWTLAAYLVINNVIAIAVEPRMMGKGLGLSTLVVFMSLFFWGFIFGIIGMFLSVPLTMAMKIIFEQNEKTRWIAILLGTPEDAKSIADKIKEDQFEN
jgi:AI-2 transport protein TqsA